MAPGVQRSMYSVDIIAAAAAESDAWLFFDRTDLHRPEFADDDVMAGDGFVAFDEHGPFYEKNRSPVAVHVTCGRGAGISPGKMSAALSQTLSEIGIEECVHGRLIYDISQSCHARTGKWIVSATVSVKVDHRCPESPGTAESAAPPPRKRRLVSPSPDSPAALSEDEAPIKKRRRCCLKGIQNWPVKSLSSEFDRVAEMPALPEDKGSKLWRMYGRRVWAVRTVPPTAPSPALF